MTLNETSDRHTQASLIVAAHALADPGVIAAVARFADEDIPNGRWADQVRERAVEYEAIVDMLMRFRTPDVDATRAEVVARAIAAGGLGDRHLWRDLDLPSRAVLRGLFEGYFAPLAAENYMDMRWKKFVYRKLCRWGGFDTCKSPSCGVCESYQECFGTES